ncbi:MAG: glycosyltransferase family 9 protein [Chlamydiota bacterium]
MKPITKLFQKAIRYILDRCIISNPNITPKTLLIIKLDAIGDYLLFRNFIKFLTTSSYYQDYQITFVCNQQWQALAEALDGQYIHKFIGLNGTRFIKEPFYRYHKLKEIGSQGYEELINPTYSRKFHTQDIIAKKIKARKKIASQGDASNIRRNKKKHSDKCYTDLIPASKEVVFEFERNKEFFEQLLSHHIDIDKPSIISSAIPSTTDLPKPYAVIFLGASASFKKWSPNNFARVAHHIKQQYGLPIVLCGGESDITEAQIFSKYFEDKFTNLVNKQSLIELTAVIKNSSLLVSNETMAPHLAVSLETPAFVVSHNNHFGRFAPYPSHLTKKYQAIFPPNNDGTDSNNVNDIKVSTVITQLDKFYQIYKDD